jgi:Lamin Tail Domain
MRHVRSLLLPLALVLACAAPTAHASSPSGLVVSQVYAGGGNSGAIYQNDFVELFDAGSAPVDLSGFTLQYASAASTSWQTTALTGTISPGHAYLVQLASTAAVGSPLPAADAVGTSNLAATGGKVALVHDTAALSCGATAGSCSGNALIADLVGYGSAADYEGAAAAPALDATTAAVRASAGCADTDQNGDDFTAAAPSPRNSSSPATSCSGSGGGGSGPSDATVDLDLQPLVAVTLDRPALGFGTAAVGATPAPLAETLTVTSTDPAGYALTVHRSAFVPGDLPLGLGASAPAGAQLGPGLGGGALAALPVAPAADLLIGSTTGIGLPAGDVWPAAVGFTDPLPALAAGHYTATVTFTVIGR